MPKRKQAVKRSSSKSVSTAIDDEKREEMRRIDPSAAISAVEKKRRITKSSNQEENVNEITVTETTAAAAAAAMTKTNIFQMKNEINNHLLTIFSTCSDYKNLNQLEESGYMETKLWPLFIQLHQLLQSSSLSSQKQQQQEQPDNSLCTEYKSIMHSCSYLIASLLNQRYNSRGNNGKISTTGSGTTTTTTTTTTSSSSSASNDNHVHDVGKLVSFLHIPSCNHKNDEYNQEDIVNDFIYYLFGYNYDDIEEKEKNENYNMDKHQNNAQKLKIESTKIQFLIHTFTSTSISTSSSSTNTSSTTTTTSFITKIINIGLWSFMPTRYRQLLLSQYSNYKQKWIAYNKNNATMKDDKEGIKHKAVIDMFIPDLIQFFLITLKNLNKKESLEDENFNNKEDDDEEQAALEFLYIVLQFFIDLLSTTSTRRYLRPYLLSINFSIYCTTSKLFKSFLSSSQNYNKNIRKKKSHKSTTLFIQLTIMLQDLETFSIQDITAKPLSKTDMSSIYHNRANILQKIVHIHYRQEFEELIYAGVSMVCNYTFLKKNLDKIGDVNVLYDVAFRLRLIDHNTNDDLNNSCDDDNDERKREFVTEVLLYHHTLRPTEEQTLSQLPLYPDEKLLWNPHLVPPGHSFGQRGSGAASTLALPKLNTQFLTFGDYLLRSFKLLRLESAYEIRSDIVDALKRMRPVPRHDYDNNYEDDLNEEELWSMKRAKTEFHGWSRMALELTDNVTCPVKLLKVAPPKLGESIPAQVLAEITLDLKRCGDSIRKEWDEIREFDNLFLVAVDATKMKGGPAPEQNQHVHIADDEDVTFPQRFGVVAVRGCMVLEVRDSNGNILSDPYRTPQNDPISSENNADSDKSKDSKRYVTVSLDASQYAADATGSGSSMGTRVYQMLNVVVRRKAKENNFRAVLETIRGLMQGSGSINRSIPSWLQPVFLGYGDPSSASFMSPNMRKFAMNTVGVAAPDSDLDYGDTFLDEKHIHESFPECSVTISGKDTITKEGVDRCKYRIKVMKDSLNAAPIISATSYPFPKGVHGNPVRFTPIQVKAIQSGLNPGLTLIVGPPGTGKTDVAVQIIANLYHSFPSQRTVLVTHSNAALNDLFAKVMARGDVDERYMLRLGSGERELETHSEFDFTKIGRVNHILSRRAKLLEEVQLLSESIGVSGAAERGPDGSPSYTCETAEYFNLHHVKKRVQIFYSNVKNCENDHDSEIGRLFPFKKYFDTCDEKLTLSDAKKLFAKLGEYFTELEEYRPLELLRSQRQRTDYLLTKQARIVAMTCTHAAIARSHLVELGFQYDNIVMEEAGQMLDIETFVPLLLQQGQMSMESRLKRICLIGDHHQLPPVVKNVSFSRYSNLDQSLFSRLIRLGVPSIDLNKQGRARPDIALLYSWRYKDLGNLEHVNQRPEFLRANAGFVYTHQIINVEDYEGRGESTPTAFFYQNVGEAEYAVALFQYMVLIGYPPEKISIITTYNGQKELINDIIAQRCAEDTPLGGIRPGAISTVDHYQGQQNDYVILSLVRTKSIGHLRDIRRLVVAVSRARLGLYVLCRNSLFSQCHELKNVFDQLQQRPKKLELLMGEQYPTERTLEGEVLATQKYSVDDVIALGKIVHAMQEQLCQ